MYKLRPNLSNHFADLIIPNPILYDYLLKIHDYLVMFHRGIELCFLEPLRPPWYTSKRNTFQQFWLMNSENVSHFFLIFILKS